MTEEQIDELEDMIVVKGGVTYMALDYPDLFPAEVQEEVAALRAAYGILHRKLSELGVSC